MIGACDCGRANRKDCAAALEALASSARLLSGRGRSPSRPASAARFARDDPGEHGRRRPSWDGRTGRRRLHIVRFWCAYDGPRNWRASVRSRAQQLDENARCSCRRAPASTSSRRLGTGTAGRRGEEARRGRGSRERLSPPRGATRRFWIPCRPGRRCKPRMPGGALVVSGWSSSEDAAALGRAGENKRRPGDLVEVLLHRVRNVSLKSASRRSSSFKNRRSA